MVATLLKKKPYALYKMGIQTEFPPLTREDVQQAFDIYGTPYTFARKIDVVEPLQLTIHAHL
jgi:hypothetical protein